jgi:phage protein U
MGVPMIDDLELKAVQRIRQQTDQAFAEQRVVGLDGTVHQRVGRRSHRVLLTGVLLPETAAADLETLQTKAAAGEQIAFTADITTALAIEHMVIESLAAEQVVGAGGQYAYAIALAESPALPAPAELSPFGGLGDFGLGDLGFDAGALDDLLGDVLEQAGELSGALDAALDVVSAIGALAALADLDLGDLSNPLKPVSDKVGELGAIGETAGGVIASLGALLPDGGPP